MRIDMERIALINDLSGFGKCSLTVALPIISAMGVETSIVPTAVLSTHTMFENFTFRDLTEDMEGNMTLHAEDRDGNRIDDYPLPKDVNDLTFDKNIKAGTAVDQLQRSYKYVYTGSDY